MAGTRILYVPWNIKSMANPFQMNFSGTPGTEFADKNNEWINKYHAKQLAIAEIDDRKEIYQVWYSRDQNGVTRSPLLDGLGPEDQVYIRGHCKPNQTYIMTDVPLGLGLIERKVGKDFVQDAQYLDALEVATRIKASGLKDTFSGKIKCYNCNSCSPLTGPNFTLALYQKLRDLGFKNCRVLGYEGTLDSFHDADSYGRTDRVGDGHKHAHDGSKDLGRARSNRYIVKNPTGSKPVLQKEEESDLA